MKITKACCAPGYSGFFFDDQKAIREGASANGASYLGNVKTPGFSAVRQKGEAVSILFLLEDGQVAYGDCAAVQYSGAGGRDPLFLAEEFIPFIETQVLPRFIGKELEAFRPLAMELESLSIGEHALHTAIRYGVSQALLDAVAKAQKRMMCEVVAEEYHTEIASSDIPIFAQSGDDRYINADKIIMKGVPVLPHALINTKKKLGPKGEGLLEYIHWLHNRIMDLRTDPSYAPIIHLDVYGTIGLTFDNDLPAIAKYLKALSRAAKPFKLRIEGPIDRGNREDQMIALRDLTKMVDDMGIAVEIVADEWCNTLEDIRYFTDNRAGHMIQIKTPDLGSIHNTVEAVLYCKEKGIGAYQGGTCNETDRSAQVCVHLAMATQPDQMLAKPGMGVDEGIMIVTNEMHRILALRSMKG